MSNKEKPSLFVGWVHNGKKSFEVIPETQYKSLIEKLLLKEGVHPGAIFISKMAMCHWIDKSYHNGKLNVWIRDFWDELNNLGDKRVEYKKTDLKKEPKKSNSEKSGAKYGYISPDGRYFQCEYYGHRDLEDKIVGKLEKIDNPQQYLYDHGWLCIYHDPFACGQYAIGMGHNKTMTNEQLKILEVLKIPHTSRGFQKYLVGEETC